MRHVLSNKDIEDIMNAIHEQLLVSSSGNESHKAIKMEINLMRGWEFIVTFQDGEVYRGPSFFEASKVYNNH